MKESYDVIHCHPTRDRDHFLSYGLSLFTGQTKKKVPFWSKIAESYAVCGTSGCSTTEDSDLGEDTYTGTRLMHTCIHAYIHAYIHVRLCDGFTFTALWNHPFGHKFGICFLPFAILHNG